MPQEEKLELTLQLRRAAVSVASDIVEGRTRYTESDYLQALPCDHPTSDQKERRRRAARVGGLLRLLRAHGILKRVPRMHRYQVTTTGRQALAAMLAAADATTVELARLAAGPKASSLRSAALEKTVLSHDDSRR